MILRRVTHMTTLSVSFDVMNLCNQSCQSSVVYLSRIRDYSCKFVDRPQNVQFLRIWIDDHDHSSRDLTRHKAVPHFCLSVGEYVVGPRNRLCMRFSPTWQLFIWSTKVSDSNIALCCLMKISSNLHSRWVHSKLYMVKKSYEFFKIHVFISFLHTTVTFCFFSRYFNVIHKYR